MPRIAWNAYFHTFFQGYNGYFTKFLTLNHAFLYSIFIQDLKIYFLCLIAYLFKNFIMRGVFFFCTKKDIWYYATLRMCDVRSQPRYSTGALFPTQTNTKYDI